jgi:hypothetical protein
MNADGFDANIPVGDPEFVAELERLANLPLEELIAENEAQGIDENQAREMVDRRSFSSSDDDLLLEPFG